MPFDPSTHATALHALIRYPDPALVATALKRMEDGRAKYERPGLVNDGRDLIAEGREELVDGLNRLAMELAKQTIDRRPSTADRRLTLCAAAVKIQHAIMILDGIG